MSTIYFLVRMGRCRVQDEKLLNKRPTFRNNYMREDPTQRSTGLKSEVSRRKSPWGLSGGSLFE